MGKEKHQSFIENDNLFLEYFIQTRKEIDTEKRERDHILNFAIVVLGAIGFAIIRTPYNKKFLIKFNIVIFLIEVSMLIIITSLFWIRRKKLQQILDRWCLLNKLFIRKFGQEELDYTLENLVVKNSLSRRYLKKDLILNIALCLPIYSLIINQMIEGITLHIRWEFILCCFVLISHLLISSILLGRKLKNPLSKI